MQNNKLSRVSLQQMMGHKIKAKSLRSAPTSDDKLDPRTLIAQGIEGIGEELNAQHRYLLEQGDDLENPRGSKNPRYQSRSEAEWAALLILLKLGVPPDIVAGILLNSRLQISARALENLRIDRDQLWAEAAELEADGFSITLPKELWAAAEALQSERTLDDPWLDTLSRVDGAIKDGVARVATETLFNEAYLDIPAANRKSYQAAQAGRTMRSLGWDGSKQIRIDGKNVRGFTRLVDDGNDDTPAI